MAVVIVARWVVRPGRMDVVLEALSELVTVSRAEPGVLEFRPFRDPARPDEIRIFDVFEDAAAVADHGESEHFQTWVVERARPALVEWGREYLESIGD